MVEEQDIIYLKKTHENLSRNIENLERTKKSLANNIEHLERKVENER